MARRCSPRCPRGRSRRPSSTPFSTTLTERAAMADGRARGTLEAYARRMQSAGAAGTRLAEQPFPAQVGLRVAPGSDAARRVEAALGVSLPVTPNTVARAGERTVLWLGPDEGLGGEPAGAEAGTEPAPWEGLCGGGGGGGPVPNPPG